MGSAEYRRLPDLEPPEKRITASAGNILEIEIRQGYWKGRAVSGTVNLHHEGEIKARASILGFIKDTDSVMPFITVTNGGPSSPTTLWNAQLFSGTHRFDFDFNNFAYRGFVPETRLITKANVLNVDALPTGLGEIYGNDKTWGFGVKRAGEINAAITEWFRSEYIDPRAPVGLIGSSYNGGIGMTANVLSLVERGIRPAALGIINGYYEHHDAKHRYDFERTGLRPFINVLPVLAVSSWYHRGLFSPVASKREEDIYEEAREFAHSKEYAKANNASFRRDGLLYDEGLEQEVAERLSYFLGISPEVIKKNHLRISPEIFTEQLFPGQKMSSIDTRKLFPVNFPTRIDPIVDSEEVILLDHIRARTSKKHGYSSAFWDFPDPYTPIIQPIDSGQWQFDGMWSQRKAHEAMKEVLRLCPTIDIRVINGMFETNTPGEREFWEDMYKSVPGLRVTHHYWRWRVWGDSDEFPSQPEEPGVNIYTIPMGHQMDSSIASELAIPVLIQMAKKLQNAA